MESQEGRRIAAILTHGVGKGVSATQIADAIISIWQEIDVALRPIIGQGGVAALYKRSLYLTVPSHPWLAVALEGPQTSMDLVLLKTLLVQQSNTDAATGGSALLQTFYTLLASLIGTSLTEQLLRSVWANSFRGFPAQDTSS